MDKRRMLTSHEAIHVTLFFTEYYSLRQSFGDFCMLCSLQLWSQVWLIWLSDWGNHDHVQECTKFSVRNSEWIMPLRNAIVLCIAYGAWVPGYIGCITLPMFCNSNEPAITSGKAVKCLGIPVFVQYIYLVLFAKTCQFRHHDHTEANCELDDYCLLKIF